MDQDVGLVLPILGNVDQFKQSMAAVKETASNAMSSVKDAIGAAGLLAAGYLKSAVESAAKGEQNFADLKQTIKSTGEAAGLTADQIKAMSKELASQTIYTGGEIMKGQNMLLTFTNISKDVFKDASMAMLDLSQKMGSAPEATAIQLGKALNDPIKGITALTRVGVTFTDQQKEQIKAMEDAGNMAGAQRVILNELNKEFGGQAHAQLDTYNGQLKQMTNNFNSIKGTIGSVLLPYFSEIARRLNEVSQSVAQFASEHKKMIAGILSATAILGTFIGGAGLLQKVLGILGPTITGITGLIGGLTLPIVAVVGAIAAMTVAYTKNFGGFKTLVDDTIKVVVTDIKALIEAFNKALQGSYSTDIIGKNFGSLSAIVQITVNAIADSINIIKDIINGDFKKVFDTCGEWFDKDANGLGATIVKAATIITGAVKLIVDIFTGNFKQAADILIGFRQNTDSQTTSVMQTIAKAALLIRDVIGEVITWFKANLPTIKATFQEVLTGIEAAWNNILKPVLSIIIQVVATVIDFVVQHFDTISHIIQTVFEIVQRLWEQILKPVFDEIVKVASAVVKYFSDNMPLIIATFKTLVSYFDAYILPWLRVVYDEIITAIKLIIDVLSGAIKIAIDIINYLAHQIGDIVKFIMQIITGDWKGAWNTAVDFIKQPINLIGNILSDLGSTIKSIFNDLVDGAITWGKNMIDGFVKGITSSVDKVKSSVKGVMSSVSDYLGFHSPSKEGEGRHIVEWGTNMISGFMDGIKAQLPAVRALMNTAIQAPSFDSDVNFSGNGSSSNINSKNVVVNIDKLISNSPVDDSNNLQQIQFAAQL